MQRTCDRSSEVAGPKVLRATGVETTLQKGGAARCSQGLGQCSNIVQAQLESAQLRCAECRRNCAHTLVTDAVRVEIEACDVACAESLGDGSRTGVLDPSAIGLDDPSSGHDVSQDAADGSQVWFNAIEFVQRRHALRTRWILQSGAPSSAITWQFRKKALSASFASLATLSSSSRLPRAHVHMNISYLS